MANVGMWMAAALMAAGAWAAGPQSTAAHQRPASASTAKQGLVRPKLSDAQLEAAIRAKFAKSKINADKFRTRTGRRGQHRRQDRRRTAQGDGHADVQDGRGGGGQQSRTGKRCRQEESGGESGGGAPAGAGQTRGCAQRAKVRRRTGEKGRDKLGISFYESLLFTRLRKFQRHLGTVRAGSANGANGAGGGRHAGSSG